MAIEKQELEDQIIARFGCDRSDARAISRKASKLKTEIETGSESWDGPEIDTDYILSRLNMAPGHLSPTGKWNWWAGTIGAFGGTNQDYSID